MRLLGRGGAPGAGEDGGGGGGGGMRGGFSQAVQKGSRGAPSRPGFIPWEHAFGLQEGFFCDAGNHLPTCPAKSLYHPLPPRQ